MTEKPGDWYDPNQYRYPRTTREAFGFIDDGHPWEQEQEPVSWIYKVCFGLLLLLAIVPCFLFK